MTEAVVGLHLHLILMRDALCPNCHNMKNLRIPQTARGEKSPFGYLRFARREYDIRTQWVEKPQKTVFKSIFGKDIHPTKNQKFLSTFSSRILLGKTIAHNDQLVELILDLYWIYIETQGIESQKTKIYFRVQHGAHPCCTLKR